MGVVLGAGSSTRLGRPKQTLPLGDTTLLGWCVREAEASRLDRVVVVLGGAAGETAASLRLTRAATAHNDAYGAGCASSLLAGLDAAGGADAIVMLLGDMPGVDRAVIDAVLTTWSAQPTWAAVTAYGDGIGHPFVFSAARSTRFAACTVTRRCGRSSTPSPTIACAASTSSALRRDVDTWDDYVAVCRDLGVDANGTI